MRKSLLAGLGLAVLSLMGCRVRVERAEDLTGDGRTDVIAKTWYNRYLFVQKEDETFLRYPEQPPGDLSNFANKYFFDGQFYRKVVKPGSPAEKK